MCSGCQPNVKTTETCSDTFFVSCDQQGHGVAGNANVNVWLIEVGAVDGAILTVTYGVPPHVNTAYQCGGGVSDS